MVAVHVSTVGMSFLTAVFCKSWPTALLTINGTNLHEMLRLLDQIDRDDLSSLLGAAATAGGINAPRILYAADVVLKRRLPARTPPDLAGSTDARTFLGRRSPLLITTDPTFTLPPVTGGSRTVTGADLDAGADLLGVERAAIQAVATVEGGRAGFGPDGRCMVRYELHTFANRTHRKFNATHPHLSNTYVAGRGYHAGGQPNEWSHLYGAAMLHRTEDAIASTSWGMFQIMGFNHAACGYPSPGTFASAMCESAGSQLQAFLRFCQANHLQRFLATKDWAGFASRYNGPSYRDNHYDTSLAAAYRAAAAHP